MGSTARAAYDGGPAGSPRSAEELVVGFDLDMTLIDSRPGIAAAWDAVAEATGVPVDSSVAVTRLGPPLEDEAAHWFPEERIPEAVETYRGVYRDVAIEPTVLLPGAAEAFAAIRVYGGRVLVVTAKNVPHARAHLDHLGLTPDEVIGDVWAEQKGVALREHGASIFVGDHVGDVRGARAAGAYAVGVATGPITAPDLAAAGADTVLTGLAEFPDWLHEHLLTTRLADLDARLAELDSVVVAFSGGADSAFLLARAAGVLGPDRVLAATAVSASLPNAERDAAAEFAASLGVRHVRPHTDEMSRDGYRANEGDRCYFCKAELLEVLGPIAEEHGIAHVATGTNADDARAGFRPGIRAAFERGAVTPLRDAGLTKAQVREASRRLGLRTWDKPAAACLSSRIAYGLSITPSRLVRVDRAESALREALAEAGVPVRDLRVREIHDDAARVEVDPDYVERVSALEAAYAAVRSAGFAEVEIDPRGFRSGSMNELLPDPERYR